MPEYKDQLDQEIRASLNRGDSDGITVRRLFCYGSAAVLLKHKEAGFDIINAVSQRFGVPFRCIYITGSVQTGYSYFKARDFIPAESDIDLAIVDTILFRRYCEIVFEETKGYTDLTKFPTKAGTNSANSFRNYIAKGYLRPDLMPNCIAKQEWFRFFNELSGRYAALFNDINCGIYFSEVFFEGKQVPLIKKFQEANK